MSLYIGIDIGSRNIKLVVLDSIGLQVLYTNVTETGVNPGNTVNSMLALVYQNTPIKQDDITAIYSTGYGRKLVKANKSISEISCHTQGVLYSLPETKAIIDIGGQDSKIISIDSNQRIKDFVMNDKCAAGTGRFLEMVALRLGVSCAELSDLAAQSVNDIDLSSTCVVFAESEIIGLIAEGTSPSDIARAVHLSIAGRIAAQLNQLNWTTPVVFTGGVAFNSDLHNLFSQQIGCDILIPPNPELTGALGAALIAFKDNSRV